MNELNLCRDIFDKLLDLMFQVKHRLQRVAENYDLTIVQAHVLMHLTADKPVTMRHLADFFMTDASTITGLVDRLVKRGLVERQSHPTDRRKVHLVLTADGIALRQKLMDSAKVTEAERIANALSADELATFHDILTKLSQ